MLELKNKKDFMAKIENNPKNIFLLYIYKTLNSKILHNLNLFISNNPKYGIYLYHFDINNNYLLNDFEITMYPIIRIYNNETIEEFCIYNVSIFDYITNKF